MGHYTCKKCDKHLAEQYFGVKQRYKTKQGIKEHIHTMCKFCRAERSAIYRATKPWQWIISRYMITPEAAQKLWVKTQTSCDICGVSWKEGNEKLCIDHCHTTGKIRGVLCKHCNHVLGHAKDSSVILENAIKYLKEN